MKSGTLLALSAVFAALMAGEAAAQVAPSQTGQSLDANMQVGSGGYNSFATGAGGVNSQLYVTGQVTGLARFHGQTIPSGSQFRAAMGSAGMDTFLGQSVGMSDAVRGNTYRPAPYFSPNTTVSNPVPNVAGGGNNFDISNRRFVDASTAEKLYVNATADYQPLMGMPASKAVKGTPLVSGTDAVGSLTSPDSLGQMGPTKPGASALFGVPSLQNRETLAKELLDIDYRVNTMVNAKVDARIGQPIDQARPETPDKAEPAVTPGPETPDKTPDAVKGSDGKLGGGLPASKKKVRTPVEKNEFAAAKPNTDIYMDILISLHESRTGKNLRIPSSVDAASSRGNPSIKRPDNWTAKPPVAQTQEGAVVERKDDGIFVHSLAGIGDDEFNSFMAKAEKQLKAGKFYESSASYQIAQMLKPENPLAPLGQGMAVFAAGEFLTATRCYQKAMEMFPPLMETKIDVASIITSTQLKRQLAELDKRVAVSPGNVNPQLLFLATFMHYNDLDTDTAKSYARMLQTLARDDKLMSYYAEFILSGKRPTSQPAATE